MTKIMIQFIEDNKYLYGLELICRVLQISPSTYHRAKDLENCPKKRSLRSCSGQNNILTVRNFNIKKAFYVE